MRKIGMRDAESDRQAKLRFVEELAKLDPVQRDVLVLHAAEGLDFLTVGERLGISVADVERHLAEALVHLDRALDGVRDTS